MVLHACCVSLSVHAGSTMVVYRGKSRERLISRKSEKSLKTHPDAPVTEPLRIVLTWLGASEASRWNCQLRTPEQFPSLVLGDREAAVRKSRDSGKPRSPQTKEGYLA